MLAAFEPQAGQNVVYARVTVLLGQGGAVHFAREHEALANCNFIIWRQDTSDTRAENVGRAVTRGKRHTRGGLTVTKKTPVSAIISIFDEEGVAW